MKIVIFSYYSGQTQRGVETWAVNLKEKLPSNFDIDIISGRKKVIYTSEKLVYFGLNFFQYLAKLRSSDIVIPTNGSIQTFLCRLGTWAFGKPLIVFGHSGPGADDKWNLLCSPNVFVAFSESQKRWAEKYKLPWTKVALIHHAVDISKFKPKNKPKKKIVLCVAANIADKRVYLVEQAVNKLPGFKFMAVGKGNPVEASHEKMPGVYRKADVFCFVPKSHEAFGLVFLEAMASNLPVVTTDDTTRREIVGNAGLFVKRPENISELARAIKRAYDTNWGDKPRRQAETFSWDIIFKEYEKLFVDSTHH